MKDKKRKRVFPCLLAALLVCLSTVPVSAKEFTDENGQSLIQSCVAFIESLYTSDTDYEAMKDLGDFYMVTSDMVLSEREELGDFIEVLEGGRYEVSSDAVTVYIPAKYRNYTAEIVITFDETENGMEAKNFVINPDYSLGEKMMQALENFILGIVIVFAVLLFLTFIISLFRFVNPDERKKKKAQKEAEQAGELLPAGGVGAQAGAKFGSASETSVVSDDPEIIAVMAAAVAAAEAEGNGSGYVVRSIRKTGSARGWTRL